MSLYAYLPQDRLRAIANNTSLPDRTSGSALFADISGFTALTESLHKKFGIRQGAEQLNKTLDVVYGVLIHELERFGGSVIGFAGDAMMCWFQSNDEGTRSVQNDELKDSSSRAVGCAFGMQEAIKKFPELALKVCLASGDARRFVVGDEEIQRIDTLAGATVTRTAIGEHLSNRGEVLIDEVTASTLGESLKVLEWREDQESKERFAVVGQGSRDGKQGSPIPDSRPPIPEVLRSWVHHAVYERETSGQGQFLTEFRPCVALFVRFTGIDYDSDSAESELDTFIREVQHIASHHEGTLINLTIGDKGSYVYVNFGALSAHEDDARRAVKTAVELRNKSALQLQMGITQGLMRTGAFGGVTRRAYDVLGDDVNLAARLMTIAKENEILLSSHVHKAVMDGFTFEPRPPLPMKGKADPLPVFAVTGESRRRAVRLQEPNYSLPMVGRQAELKLIEEKLELAQKGKSQVVGIVAEAGLGKSRLVAEVIRNARRKGFVGFGGACQSDGIHTPYLAWKSIWGAFFEVDPDSSLKKQMRNIEGEIEDRAPSRVDAMPLLNVVLDLNIPENDFTKNLEPKIRQSALHALLEDCLKAQAKDEPTLIVIEDLHWIDALSHDLLEQLAKALAGHAVCFVLAYRPPQIERLQNPRLVALEQFTRIELHELTTAEAESAVRAKLTQLYPARGGALPAGLVEALMKRAQGNPFYLEELLNYVRDRGLDPSDIQNIELPDSLHTLILSRIDQLSEAEKTTLRVASIVGRLFRAQWLTGYYPELGSFPQVKAALDALSGLDITPLDSPEPELAYLFKHIVTHEVTYESLPFATRARLHEQLARYLESADAPVETIAFHYGRSENKNKQMEYLRKAGEASQKNFANDAALEYYGLLLTLLEDEKEKAQIHLKRGEVYELIGKYDDAESNYCAALDSAKDNLALKASAQFALGKLQRQRGDYEPALEWLGQAKAARTQLEDTTGLVQVLIETGMVLYRKGEWVQAYEALNKGLMLTRQIGDTLTIALALNNLANLANRRGDYTLAQELYEESLSLRKVMGDKVGISASLGNLGIVAYYQGNYTAAWALYEESLMLSREIGDKTGISFALANLGNLASIRGDYSAARELYEETEMLFRETGDRWGIASSLGGLGRVVLAQGEHHTAQALFEESLLLFREMNNMWGIADSLSCLGNLRANQGDYTGAKIFFEEALAINREMVDKRSIAYSLKNLGEVIYAQGDYPTARAFVEESLALQREMGDTNGIATSLCSLGNVALAQGDYSAAQALHEESLTLYRETGEKLGIANLLQILGNLALAQGNFPAAWASFEESLALCKEINEKTIMAYVLLGLGLMELAENKAEARENILGSLLLRRETGEQHPQTSSLIGAAGWVLQEGHPQFAAQLLGAVQSALKGLNAVMEPEMKFFYEQTLTKVKEALGEAAFQSAWEEGSQWSLEEAVKRALELSE